MVWTRLFDPWPGEAWSDVGRLRRELDDAFERFGARPGRGTPFPPVNLYESPEGFVLTAEVPGVRQEDLEVSVEGERVTLRGERRIDLPDDASTSVHRRERQSGIFRRTLELPVPVESEKAQAVYRNGILMLRIPKAAAHQPRRIAVQGG